ncbi:MAG: hypothetical protein Q7T18_04670 [Sedimentisphaerales bacterium]|nr:hypothetical protein [Sedimentisphaerales bacterium]
MKVLRFVFNQNTMRCDRLSEDNLHLSACAKNLSYVSGYPV